MLNVIARIGEYGRDTKFPLGGGLFSSVVGLVFQVYIFVCIDSLYKKFEEENLPRSMMPPSPYVVDYQSQPQNPYAQRTHFPIYPPVPSAPDY